jgi:tripartite ATP-independent transporter DctP family solute receptor
MVVVVALLFVAYGGPAPPPVLPIPQAAAQTRPPEFVLRLGWVTGDKGMQGVQAHGFKEEAEKNSSGRIKVDLFCCGQLGGELEQVAAVRAGRLDMHSGAATTVGSLTPAVYIALLPFFYPDRETAWKVLDGEAGQMALKALEPLGVKGLAWGESGLHGLLNHRRPINAVSDLRGLKVRVVETPLFVSAWRALGASPVPMAWPEVYTGLQQRTIDGVDTVYQAMLDGKFHEVTSHLTLTNHAYSGLPLIINLARFNALPPDLQKVVQDAAKFGASQSRKAAQKADEFAIETFRGRGLTVTSLPRAEIQAATKSVYDEFVPKIGPDIVAKARAAMGTR